MCAIVAKIHTIDWTVELLKTDVLRAGMRINWYGIIGELCPSNVARFEGGGMGKGQLRSGVKARGEVGGVLDIHAWS